jgi:hypothetical protein
MRILSLAVVFAAAVVVGAPGVASAQTACAELGGTVGRDQICRVHVENGTYTMDMNFPNDYPDQQAITAYLTQARDGFVNVAHDPDAYNLPYVLDAEGTGYRSGLPLIGTQSLVFEVYENVGGAHPSTFYEAFNWNLAKRAPITFDTLFKPGTKPLDIIYPEVNRYLQKQQGIIDPVSPGAGLDPANYQNFALTDDAVIFFFSRGELMAGAAGAMQASVPRAALAPVLAL